MKAQQKIKEKQQENKEKLEKKLQEKIDQEISNQKNAKNENYVKLIETLSEKHKKTQKKISDEFSNFSNAANLTSTTITSTSLINSGSFGISQTTYQTFCKKCINYDPYFKNCFCNRFPCDNCSKYAELGDTLTIDKDTDTLKSEIKDIILNIKKEVPDFDDRFESTKIEKQIKNFLNLNPKIKSSSEICHYKTTIKEFFKKKQYSKFYLVGVAKNYFLEIHLVKTIREVNLLKSHWKLEKDLGGFNGVRGGSGPVGMTGIVGCTGIQGMSGIRGSTGVVGNYNVGGNHMKVSGKHVKDMIMKMKINTTNIDIDDEENKKWIE